MAAGDLWAPAPGPPVAGDVFVVLAIPADLPVTAVLTRPATSVILYRDLTTVTLDG